MNPIPSQNQGNAVPCAIPNSLSAFDALYDKYAAALFGVINTIIADDHAAMAILQESFIQIWESIDEYDADKMQLFTWMYRLTKSVACAYKNDFINYTATNAKPNNIKKAVAFSTFAKNYSR